MIEKIKKIIKRIIPDKIFVKIIFKKRMGYKLDLKNPKSYNEKLQWLKLYDRNPEYTKLVDKYEVRKYIEEVIGEEYLIPLIGVYNSYNEIDFDKLPKEFVIKATHTSGDVIVIKDKDEINHEMLRKTIERWLKTNYFYNNREWPYKNVKPRIIIEKLIKDSENKDLFDYKILCFNGKPKYIEVMSERFSGNNYKVNYFDTKWKRLNIERLNIKQNPKEIKRPQKLEEMIEVAAKLSQDKSFVRIDLYNVDAKIYFGEITFYPASGHVLFKDEKFSKYLGDLIKID